MKNNKIFILIFLIGITFCSCTDLTHQNTFGVSVYVLVPNDYKSMYCSVSHKETVVLKNEEAINVDTNSQIASEMSDVSYWRPSASEDLEGEGTLFYFYYEENSIRNEEMYIISIDYTFKDASGTSTRCSQVVSFDPTVSDEYSEPWPTDVLPAQIPNGKTLLEICMY